jgi:osmoprotectant transport system permease protein
MSVLEAAWHWLTDSANWSGSGGIPTRLLEHLRYSALALLLAAGIAIPLGLVTGHTGRGGLLIVNLVNAARALPTLGLLVLVVLATSVGLTPVLVALVALAIPPILVNVYEGIRTVDADLKDAARGMGMTGWGVLARLELPVAMPLVLLGLRTAAIQIVATATVAAYVGIGGLGRFIFEGQRVQDVGMVAGGSLLVVALALLVSLLFVALRRAVVPAGVRLRTTRN